MISNSQRIFNPSENLLADPKACGSLRKRRVGITGSTYQPLEVPQLIEESFELLLKKADGIIDPFEQAFFVMVHIPYLQPFEDVNKRVSRLAANLPFVRHNLCPLSFIDMPQDTYTEGIMGVYEINRIELLRDIFVWAYNRSASRYAAVRQSLGEPYPFRMRYRNEIRQLVSSVLTENITKKDATAFIRKKAAANIPEKDISRFIEVIETELMGLHEGNIARYRIRPSGFQRWQERNK